MDPVKIAIFLAAFALLLIIGRMLAGFGENRIDAPPQPGPDPAAPHPDAAALGRTEDDSGERRAPALTGVEVGLPIQLPPLQRMEDGGFNRPLLTNYYFAKIDLIRGPADPACFDDDLFLQLRDPDDVRGWTSKFTVATPAGLRQVMDREKFESIYLDGAVVIVARWDLPLILHTVIEEIMGTYKRQDVAAGVIPEPDPSRSES